MHYKLSVYRSLFHMHIIKKNSHFFLNVTECIEMEGAFVKVSVMKSLHQ